MASILRQRVATLDEAGEQVVFGVRKVVVGEPFRLGVHESAAHIRWIRHHSIVFLYQQLGLLHHRLQSLERIRHKKVLASRLAQLLQRR